MRITRLAGTFRRSGMSLDEDERLRSDAEVECFLRSVAPRS
jgi:hypothetical protein